MKKTHERWRWLWSGTLLVAVALVVWLCLTSSPVSADERWVELGEPPEFHGGTLDPELLESHVPPEPEAVTRLRVNPKNRRASRAFFKKYYLGSQVRPMRWTGSYASCDAGRTAGAFRNAMLLRVNYFRAMAGVPARVVFAAAYNIKAQKAALMMGANCSLSHDPPRSWRCYSSAGDQAAKNSNLCTCAGPEAITAYMSDFGPGNYPVGHRRWILYPQTKTMGTGDVPEIRRYCEANALWVFDSNLGGPRPATREKFVAWPPPGYVPYQVVFPRWSFSFPEANFSAARVSMTSRGSRIPVRLEEVRNGFGENTLVWVPRRLKDGDRWPKPARDTTYRVTIRNARLDGIRRSFAYSVTVFDPR